MIPEHIFFHARENDVEPIRRWLASGPRNLNENKEDGGTILRHAMERPRTGLLPKTELIKLLIANGADPNLRDERGFTPLFWCEYPEEVDALLDGGAEIDYVGGGAETDEILTPLLNEIWALLSVEQSWRNGIIKSATRLIRRGADLSAIDSDGFDAESLIRSQDLNENGDFMDLADLIADVKRAGGWRRYVKEPRIELVRLRSLCLRGRATLRRATRPEAVAPHSVLQRLFGAPSTPAASNKSARVASPVPREVFWHILSYWKSARDEE